MLQRIRDNSSGPIAYVIVGLIALVFGVWGIGSYFTPSANPVVASVGDIKITKYQLKQAYNQRYRRLQQMMGDNFEPGMIDPKQLKRSILRRKIRAAVLQEYAYSAGYRTTDRALLQALKTDPRFQVNGQFSTQRYKTLLANAGLQPATFESRLRHRMVSQQVRAALARSAFAAEPGVKYAYSRRHQKRKVAYLVFPAAAYKNQVEITSGEIKRWYKQHTDQYMRPERVKLAYVELDRSELKPQHAVTPEAMHSLYKKRKAQFSTPDRRDGRQIFVPVKSGKAADARRKIQAISSKLANGKTFDDIAGANNGSVQVRKLSDVTRAELSPDVAAAFFSLDIGQVSTPIRTGKGWYLVKPTAAQPGQTKPFDSAKVQKQLKHMLRTQWRNEHFSKRSDRMEALAFQAPNSLHVIAKKLDLEIKTTGWITREHGDELGQYSAVREAAFSNDVLKKRLNSTVIRVGKGRKVVVRVRKYQRPQPVPLAQVKDKIRKQLVRHKAQKLAKKAARSARDKLAGGASLSEVASSTPAKLKQPGYIGRRSTSVPVQVSTKAFALSKPSQGEARYGITQMSGHDVALVALRDVKIKEAGAADIPQRFVQGQRSYIAQLEYTAFVNYLHQHADIDVNKENISFK